MILRKRELQDGPQLFDLIRHPDVFPFVREKANTVEEYLFVLKHLIDLDETGDIVSRVIQNEYGQPIGTINLFDIHEGSGFLGTWLGKEFHGQGYNDIAKEQFFLELFEKLHIRHIFMKVRKTNVRSQKAVGKIPYILKMNTFFPEIYQSINEQEDIYDLYMVEQNLFYSYMNQQEEQEMLVLEA